MFRQSSPATRRQEIIDVFLFRAPVAQRYEVRQKLENMSNEELEIAHAALQAQAQLQAQEERLFEVQAEADVQRALYEDRMFKAYESRDHETFKQAALALQFGENDANFGVIRSVLGWNLTEDRIQQAVDSNAISLSPPTQEELSKWESEQAAANQELDQKGRLELLALVGPRIAQSEYKFTIQNFIRTSGTYAQLRDRVQLCEEIANNHSPDQRVNNQEFCLLFLSKKDNESFRQQVAALRENKQIAAMSPLEIKSYLAKQRAAAAQQSHEERVASEIVSPQEQTLLKAVENDQRPPLPERAATGEEINSAYLQNLRVNDYSGYRDLLQRHGRLRLEARIRGVK